MNYSELYKRKEKEGTFFPSNFYISSQTNKDFGEINWNTILQKVYKLFQTTQQLCSGICAAYTEKRIWGQNL